MVMSDSPRHPDGILQDALVEEAVAQIRRILTEDLGIERSAEAGDALAGDLHVDSMGALVLAVGLEDHFRVELDDGDTAGVVTVGDLAGLVAGRVRERRAAVGKAPWREGGRE